jgi:hypothetical protein
LFDQDTQSYFAMSDFALKKVFLPAALTTGAVFAALTAPMFVFAAQPAKVQVLGSELSGERVQDYAVPYLGLAGLVSTGIGVSGVAAMGLRRSVKQSNSMDEKLERVRRQVDERATYLQSALSSDSYLTESGLNFFLDDEIVSTQQRPMTQLSDLVELPLEVPLEVPLAMTASVAGPEIIAQVPADSTALQFDDLPGLEAFFLEGSGVSELALLEVKQEELVVGVVTAVPVAAIEQLAPVAVAPVAVAPAKLPAPAQGAARVLPFTVIAATPIEPVVLQALPKPVTAQTAVMPLTAAQGFLSYSRLSSGVAAGQTPWNPVMAAQEQAALAKIQALQTQLQQIVVQIESLQTNLQTDGQDRPTQGWVAAPAPQRVSAAELNWKSHPIAS